MNATCAVDFILFIYSPQAHGMVPPTFRWIFPLQLVLGTPKDEQEFVCYVVLDHVKLKSLDITQAHPQLLHMCFQIHSG